MNRDLDHEYDLLRTQYYKDKALTADKYLQGIQELAEAYEKELWESGVMPRPLEALPVA